MINISAIGGSSHVEDSILPQMGTSRIEGHRHSHQILTEAPRPASMRSSTYYGGNATTNMNKSYQKNQSNNIGVSNNNKSRNQTYLN